MKVSYPNDAKVTSASSLPGQSGNTTNCTSPIKLASLNRTVSPTWDGRPPNQMQRVIAVMPRPGLIRGLDGRPAFQLVVSLESALQLQCVVPSQYTCASKCHCNHNPTPAIMCPQHSNVSGALQSLYCPTHRSRTATQGCCNRWLSGSMQHITHPFEETLCWQT